jgi:hypothetical protein
MVSGLARSAGTLVLVLLLGVAALAALVFETQPRVRRAGPPDAAAAAQAREVASSLQALLAEGGGDRWSVSEAALNGALASAGRVVPGLVGRGAVGAQEAAVDLSLAVPRLPWELWVNLRLALGASEGGLRVTEARVGRLPLPPGLVLPAARRALDLVLGDGLGTRAVEGIEAVRMDGARVEVALDLPRAARLALYESLRDRLRALAGGSDRELIYAFLNAYPDAARRGALPRQGSALPYLRYTLGLAAALDGDAAEVMQAALHALALYCGDARFGLAIGVALGDRLGGGRNRCRRTTLEGREDLRQHFTLAAGLYAASDGGATFGLGELKELLDSNQGGSGFSFDDIAADLAGARFAETFLRRPREEWPRMLAAIRTERDVLPRLDDLPSGMSEADFRARFGSVDDPRYRALIAEIERRIAALPLYSGLKIN